MILHPQNQFNDWRWFLPQLAIGMVVLKVVTHLAKEHIPNTISSVRTPRSYPLHFLLITVCMFVRYVAEKVNMLWTYTFPYVDWCDARMFLHLRPLAPRIWLPVRNTYVHSWTPVGKLWSWRCRSQKCFSLLTRTPKCLHCWRCDSVQLLSRVLGIVASVVFLRLLS